MGKLCKILIAEDELMIRQGIKYLVDWEFHGFDVVAEAKNGQEALRLIEETRPDVVITDIVMPAMNGIELIKEITRLYPEIQVIVLSGYSDFEYVKHSFRSGAIDYILKPSLTPDELLSAVIKAAGRPPTGQDRQDGRQSMRYLFGRLLSGHCPQDVAITVSKRFPEPCFLLFGIDTENVATPVGMGPFLDTLNGIEPDFLEGTDYERIVFDTWVLVYIINIGIMAADGDIEGKLAGLAIRAGHSNSDLFFVCSNRFSGAENIGIQYRNEFSRYLRERFYHKYDSFMQVAKFEKPDGKRTFRISELSKLLSIGNLDQSINLLSERFKLMVNNRLMPERDIKALAQNAMYQLITVMDETLGDIPNLESLKARCLARISKARFAEDFLEDFSASLDELSDIIREKNDNPNESVMPRILAYINENYGEQLTLSHLAEKFNLNYNYLSTYFGSNNTEGFSKYLTHIRIDKAKEQLSESDTPVSDICANVGYTDHSYFTRVFRKLVGSTPSAYRAKIQKVHYD